MRRLVARIPLLLLLLVVVIAPFSQPANAQSKTLVWEQYDVFLDVLDNGDVRVTERQTIRFTSGTFSFGYAVIPLRNTEGMFNFSVSEPGGRTYQEVGYGVEPYTYYVTQQGDEVEVRWNFPPVANDSRTYDLSYTVRGAIRIYNEGDKFQWVAIDNERDFPVLNSSVQVTLPQGASFIDIDSAGVSADWQQSEGGRVVRYVAVGRMSTSDTFEIGVQFTHGVVTSAAPRWQTAYDQQTYFDLNVRPMLNLGLGALALVIGIGGPLAVYLLWYTRGRDPSAGVVPEFVESPPDDIPPGVLGSLVDEQADMRDIVATIVDLARRGYLEIEEVQNKGIFGLASSDFTFRRLDGGDETQLRAYEKRILRGIFPGSRKERKLSALRNKFYTKLPGIQEDMYKELVREGLFKRRPDVTRRRWSMFGGFMLVGAFLIGLFSAPLTTYSALVPCVAVAIGIGAIAMMIAGRHMPVKTAKGSESAAKWAAFKRYLGRIEHMQDLKQASDAFESYLPYAIAFGMNQSWVAKFSRLEDTPAPGWYVPYPRGPMASGGGRGLAGDAAPDLSRPGGGLQSMSDNMAGGLQSMSDGLTSMLNSAGRIMQSAPSSSGSSGGGGFSGGGFSGGGGGGGGGRGFG